MKLPARHPLARFTSELYVFNYGRLNYEENIIFNYRDNYIIFM